MSACNDIVIIGNGAAAVGCIEGVRAHDKKVKITVVSAEKHPAYYRPLISYYLEGKSDPALIGIKNDGFYAENHVDIIYGKKAVSLDAKAKTVLLDDGEVVPYGKVCIAAGSSPFVPPFAGLDSVKKKHSFMTIDDAYALEKDLSPETRVFIVGAGLIGLKCAEGIRERVADVTVCDLADRVLPSILDEECSSLMAECLEKNGVTLMTGDSVERFDKNTAYMKSGRTVGFDVLVLAVGVRANTSLVKDAGGDVGRGIAVDTHMKTSLCDVYAAGDCTECTDISSGTKKVIAILPNARMQGRCAGANMAGADEEFTKSVPMNAIGFFGLHAMTAGTRFSAEDGGREYTVRHDGGVKKLFTKDGVLTGFMMVGHEDRVGIYTAMIREKTPLGELDSEKLLGVPTLSVFGGDFRKKKLGGEG